MENNSMKKIELIARLAMFGVSLINEGLTVSGMNPLPFSDDFAYRVISFILFAICSVWLMWKNNSFTKGAKAGDKVMEAVKSEEISAEVIDSMLEQLTQMK